MYDGFFLIRHFDKKGNLLWEDEGHNSLADEGEENILDTYFRGKNPPSGGFFIGLFNDTPVDTDKIRDLVGEPTTNGYARQFLAQDETDWPTLELDNGDFMITSAPKTFSAIGGSWGPVTHAVIMTKGLDVPTGLTVTPVGTTGTTTYGYRVTAVAANGGETLASAEVKITTGNATLSASNYNALAWNTVPGAVQYKVYRTTGGATQGLIATVSTNSYNDQGAAANGSVPVTDTSGRLIAYKALSQSRTVADGESIEVTYKIKLK